MKTQAQKNEQKIVNEFRRLLISLKKTICDDYQVEGAEENAPPCMQVTFGMSRNADGELSWNYQTGDNSFMGGAYSHPAWGVVYLSRRSNSLNLAHMAFEECFARLDDCTLV